MCLIAITCFDFVGGATDFQLENQPIQHSDFVMAETFKKHLEGKRIVITGAGKGIGRALAIEFYKCNCIVYAISRTQSDLDSLVEACPGIKAINLELSNWNNTRKVLEEYVSGGVDVLINNAGVGSPCSILELTEEHYDEIMGINLKATVNVAQFFARRMVAEKVKGTIINVSSAIASRPFSPSPIYSASKAGVEALTKCMAVDLAKYGINVVSHRLGFVETPIHGKLSVEESSKVFAGAGQDLPLGIFIPMEQVVASFLFIASGMVDMMAGPGMLLDGAYSSH